MLSYILGIAGILILSFFFFKKSFSKAPKQSKAVPETVKVEKPNYGEIQIFYASQTGTAAKMANTFV